MEELAHEIVRLQQELDREIERRRKALGWSLKARLVEFEHGIVAEHKRLRMGVTQFIAQSSFRTLVLIDLWTSLYQAICFRAYGIPRVRRRDHIALDRGHLAYLNWIEALNCTYCSYGNGVVSYVREVAARTEQYWCPIKHALKVSSAHARYGAFLEYGDAEGYRARLESFREALRNDKADPA